MKKEHIIYIAAGVVVVIAVVAYLLLSNSTGCPSCGTQVSSSTLQQMSQIANNYTLAGSVGSGIAVSGPYSNLPKAINSTPLLVDGKPEILYVGGDFCPYCAVTRWGLILALMRFGNFTNLTYMKSSPTDVYPNTATFSFTNFSYSSSVVHFDAFEIYDRLEQNLTPSGFSQSDRLVFERYSAGSIPFIDFANTSAQSGSPVSPAILVGDNWNQVISYLNQPSSPQAQGVIGIANEFTAAICASNQQLNSTAVACKQSYLKSLAG